MLPLHLSHRWGLESCSVEVLWRSLGILKALSILSKETHEARKTEGHTCFNVGRECKEVVSHRALIFWAETQFTNSITLLPSCLRHSEDSTASTAKRTRVSGTSPCRPAFPYLNVSSTSNTDHADHVFFPGARSAVRSPTHALCSMRSMHAALFSIHSAHSVLVMLCHAVPGSLCVGQTQYTAGPITVFQARGTGPNSQTFR